MPGSVIFGQYWYRLLYFSNHIPFLTSRTLIFNLSNFLLTLSKHIHTKCCSYVNLKEKFFVPLRNFTNLFSAGVYIEEIYHCGLNLYNCLFDIARLVEYCFTITCRYRFFIFRAGGVYLYGGKGLDLLQHGSFDNYAEGAAGVLLSTG